MLGEALSDAASGMEQRDAQDKSRDEGGFRGDVSAADRTAISDNRGRFILKGFGGYLAAQTSSSRRKRSTGAKSFHTLETFLRSFAITVQARSDLGLCRVQV